MRELYDKETNFRTYGSNDEYGAPPRECDIVREPLRPAETHESAEERIAKSEYNDDAVFVTEAPTEEQKTKKRHDILKQYVLKPALSLTLVLSLAHAALGIDFLGDDYLSSAFTTMNSEWIEEHPEEWGKEPHGYWEEPWNEPWEEPWEESPDDPWNDPDESAFPELDHPDPDWLGLYSWSEEGPELYLRIYMTSDENETAKYFVKGAAWDVYDPGGELFDELDGAYYDSSTNTLTLRDFSCYLIDANLMGNGFTVRLEGESDVDYITVWGAGYGGSVTFEGNGTLRCGGLTLNVEYGAGCIMVKNGVTLDLHAQSSSGALAVYDTLLDTPLYLEPGMYMEGGSMERISEIPLEDEDGETYYAYTYVAKDSSGNYALDVTVTSD